MKTVYKLSKQEIGQAITGYIALQEGKSFFPARIVQTNMPELPEEIDIAIEFISKGTKIDGAKHNI